MARDGAEFTAALLVGAVLGAVAALAWRAREPGASD